MDCAHTGTEPKCKNANTGTGTIFECQYITVRISDDFDIPVGLKTRKVFSLAAKIISSQFYQTQRLLLCHILSEQDSNQLPATLLGIPLDCI
jgi:hypothetical protein